MGCKSKRFKCKKNKIKMQDIDNPHKVGNTGSVQIKNYIYRMKRDTGFAPNIDYKICTLSGCKKTTIEVWAKRGSWIIGIGGNKTYKPDKIIYAMEVEENLTYSRFKKKYHRKSKYLSRKAAGTNVLISKKFYYFGDNAIDIPQRLKHIIIDRCGCKKCVDKDINKLKDYFQERGYKHYDVFGKPNNMEPSKICGKC